MVGPKLKVKKRERKEEGRGTDTRRVEDRKGGRRNVIENSLLDEHMRVHCVPGYLRMGVLQMFIVRFR